MEFKFRAGDLRPSPPPPPPRSDSPQPPEFQCLSNQGFPDASLKLNTNIIAMSKSFDTNEAMPWEMELMRLREEKLLMEIEKERFLKEQATKKLMLFEREIAIRGVAQSAGYSFHDQNRRAAPLSTAPPPSLAWGVAQSRFSAAHATSPSLSPAQRVVESTSYATPSPFSAKPLSFSAKPSPFSATPSPFSATPSPFSATPSPFSATPSPFSATPSPFSATPSPFSARPSPFSARPSPFSARPSPFSATPSPFNAKPSPIRVAPFSATPFNATPSPFSATPSPFSATPSPFSATPSPFSARPSPFSATPSPFSATPSPFSATPSPFSAKPSPIRVAPFSATPFNTTLSRSPATTLSRSPATTLSPSPATTLSPSPAITLSPSLTTTLSPSPATTLSPSPATTLAPSPATTLAPSPATTLAPSPATTLAPSPATTVSPSPATTVSPSPATTLSPSPATTLSPSPATTLSPSPATTLAPSPATTLAPSPATTLAPSPATTLAPSPATTLSPSPATTLSPSPATTLSPSPATTPVMHSFNDWWKIEHLKSSNPLGFGVVSLPPWVQPLIADDKKELQVLHAVKRELMEKPDLNAFREKQKVKTASEFTFDIKPFGVKKNPKDEWSCADLRARKSSNVSQAASEPLSSKRRKLLEATELSGSVGAKEKESKVGETIKCEKTEGSFILNPIVPSFLKFAAKEDKQQNELVIELPQENPNPYVVREKQKVETLSASTFDIQPFGVKKNPKEEWSCALCQLTMWSEMSFSEHLYGKRHKREEADLRARMVSNVSQAATEPVPNKRRKLLEVTEASCSAGAEEKESKVGETLRCEKTEGSFKLNATVPNFLKLAAKEDKQQNEWVISYPNVFREKQKAEMPLASTVKIQPFDVKKNPKEWARCQVTVPSERIFNEHLHGKKHKHNLIMRLQEKPDPRENQKVKMPWASTVNIQPFGVQKKPKNGWRCELCHVTMWRKKTFNQHFRGKRHKRKEASLGSRKESNVSQAATDPVLNERRNLIE